MFTRPYPVLCASCSVFPVPYIVQPKGHLVRQPFTKGMTLPMLNFCTIRVLKGDLDAALVTASFVPMSAMQYEMWYRRTRTMECCRALPAIPRIPCAGATVVVAEGKG
jgi:hypothetical protein